MIEMKTKDIIPVIIIKLLILMNALIVIKAMNMYIITFVCQNAH